MNGESKETILKKFNKLPWIEKYRPNKINSILLEENVRNEINRIIKDKEVKNIIITGKPGIGKTTTIKCLAKQMYNKYYDQFVLELNASDDRGIKIEQDIINFCKILVNVNDEDKDICPKHKLIIFDEADNITEKAQNIISKLMGTFKDTTRFAFTCNTSYNIIESIQSRCNIILRYQRVNNNKIKLRLKDICDIEKIAYDDGGIQCICDLAEGDMRSALNITELVFRKHKIINNDSVSDISDKPHKDELINILNYCNKNDYKNSLFYSKELKKKGYSGIDIISGFFNILKNNIILFEDNINIIMSEIIHETLYNISKTSDCNLHLYCCILKLSNTKFYLKN
mgnify:CR=1 FL=1